MREYELEVLEQYDIEITGTRKARGAFFCDTKEGTMLLKETKMSARRAPFFYAMLWNIKETGGMNVELPVKNKEESFISTARDGRKYMLKHWFEGKECDVFNEKEILQAVQLMAVLHTKMWWQQKEEENLCIPTGRHLKEEFLCHNREMKKVRSYIRQKVKKGKFEYLYLQYFEKMFSLAQQVTKKLEESGYEDLYRESIEQKKMIHGDYNYHNIIILPERKTLCEDKMNRDDRKIALTGFEHFCIDVQAQDLYYFFRKVLEKYRWNERIGYEMLRAYNSVRKLKKEELEYLALRLAYPEKFWKTASSYYRSNKAWVSEKNVEKLSLSIAETEERMRFINCLFSLEL